MTAPGSVRLFVGAPIAPDAAAYAAAVARAVRTECDAAGWKASWVREESYHFTLRFLGQVDADRVDAIAAALDGVGAHRAFPLRLAGVGAFPNWGRPKVLWIGVDEGASDLAELAREVGARLDTLGFSREDRPYRAHLTIARVKLAGRRVRDVVKAVSPEGGAASLITEAVLYRSEQGPEGSRYHALARFPLATAIETR